MHGGISPSLDSLDNIRQLDRIQEAILVPQTLNPEIQKNMTMPGKSTMKMYFLLKIGIFQCHVRF